MANAFYMQLLRMNGNELEHALRMNGNELELMNNIQQQVEQRAIERLASRKLARRSFLHFILFLRPDYVVKPFHRIIIEQVQKWIDTPNSKLIINTPPQVGKSEICSRYLPAFIFGLDSAAHVVACSYGQSLASSMKKDVTRIMNSDEYIELFPNVRLAGARSNGFAQGSEGYTNNTTEFDIVGTKANYRCAGVEGGITGKPMSFGIVDDPHKDAIDSSSPKTQQTVWDWYNMAFLTRCSPDARLLIMATRWNPLDLVGRILQSPDGKNWIVISFPLVCDEESYGTPFEYREIGECLWPENYTEERLTNLKAESHSWNSIYQQHPTNREGNVIKKDWFNITYALPDKFTSIVLNFDVGGSSNPTADSTVGTIIAKSQDGRCLALYQSGFRLDSHARNSKMNLIAQEWFERYPGLKIFIEAGIGLGVQSINDIRNGMLALGLPARLDHVSQSKYIRATTKPTEQTDSFLAAAQAQRIEFYGGFNQNNWIEDIFTESLALQFKQTEKGVEYVGGHDDRLDSMTSAYIKCNKGSFQIKWLGEQQTYDATRPVEPQTINQLLNHSSWK